MSNNQSLNDIINELPNTFVNRVMEETNAGNLLELKRRHACYNRRAVITARIENIMYLSATGI